MRGLSLLLKNTTVGALAVAFRHLNHDDRIKIEALYKAKNSPKVMAKIVGCSLSTIYRELQRGYYQKKLTSLEMVLAYSADIAQNDYDYKATNKGSQLKIGNDFKLVEYIEDRILKHGFSPDAIIGELQVSGKKFETSICTKTLYNYIDKQVFLHVSNNDLLRKRYHKRDYKKVHACRTKKPLCTSIEERPKEIEERKEFGHWEMDTVVGKQKGKGQALLVLTERSKREERVIKLKSKTQHEVIKALNRLERQHGSDFRKIFKTITVDNGSEFLDCDGIEQSCRNKSKRTKVYYCHPFSSWERGSNENANSLIRRFIPKGTPIENYSTSEIAYIEHWINNYPRRILGYHCSSSLFSLALQNL